MYEILKKRSFIISIIVLVFITTCTVSYYMCKGKKEQQLHVEIYSIEFCPLCEQVKMSLPNKLKEKFGNSVIIDIINVDEKDNEKKYENLVNSIDNFNNEHRNRFPLINVENFFTVVGYDYYYDTEIINDIIRMNKGNNLGKRLEKSRYLWRD